jgi:DNA-binding NtrC family response regulator
MARGQTKSADIPLVVGLLRERGVRDLLLCPDWELATVPNHKRLLSADFARSPRLFVVESGRHDTDATCDVVSALRRARPLTDVLIWAPQAGGKAVRAFFHAGAKDVAVGRSALPIVETVREILDAQQFLPKLDDLSRQRSRGGRFESMLSRSERMWDLFALCARIAPTEATVLIVGETGTGKELVARAIHRRSKRCGRFVAANCASIPAELIDSVLFGHEKGAFTGADRAKKGLVTHAHEGTLLLDEIGDMPTEGQLSLLRVLQEKKIRPVGGLTETPVDVRVIASTNVSLANAVRNGTFREDLYYRLDVIHVDLPPLRERPEDILFLFGYFSKRLSKHYGLDAPVYTDGFIDALLAHSWPGNVRQLENFTERLVLARPQRALTVRDFDKLKTTGVSVGPERRKSMGRERSLAVDTSKTLHEDLTPIVDAHERAYLVQALTENAGRVADTAEKAGISRRTLLRKMKQHRIDKRSFKEK